MELSNISSIKSKLEKNIYVKQVSHITADRYYIFMNTLSGGVKVGPMFGTRWRAEVHRADIIGGLMDILKEVD